jgi:hypothetical protein
MVYLLKMVIFHGDVCHNQRVIIKDLLKNTYFHGILWIFPEEIMGSLG